MIISVPCPPCSAHHHKNAKQDEDTTSPINVNNSISVYILRRELFFLLLLATVPARLCVTKTETNEKHIAERHM